MYLFKNVLGIRDKIVIKNKFLGIGRDDFYLVVFCLRKREVIS